MNHRHLAGWARLCATAVCWAACVTGAWAQAAAPAPAAAASQPLVPVADFFRTASMARPLLSPSGKHLAVHVGSPEGRTRLAVLSTTPPYQPKVVASFSETDVHQVHWVNDERLVFTVADWREALDHWGAPGLYAVDRDGSNFRQLVQRNWRPGVSEGRAAQARLLEPNHHLIRLLRDGSSDVVLQRTEFDAAHGPWAQVKSTTPLRLDTRNARVQTLDTNWSRPALRWWVDRAGVPRALTARDGDQAEIWWRPAADSPWAMIDRQPLYRPGRKSLLDLQLGEDGQLYAEAVGSNAAGTTALHRWDAQQQRLESEPLVRIDGFDFAGHLLFDGRDRSLVGVRYLSDARGTAWLRADLQQMQARIDARLPGLVNLVDTAECGGCKLAVVSSSSDRQPEVYWLYDIEADRLEPLGQSQPQIDASRMARRDFVRFDARDGLSIPMLVTRPAGKGPWPTVVLVHGGPYMRGSEWAWDSEAQFLASRGYLVLEPEFRGSTGFGARHFRAGWKQWGLKSQDDIADAARWAISNGDADANRVCIAGGSYGGYAALKGLVRDGDLYRCGLAWMAVTDIGLMFDLSYSDFSDLWRAHSMPVLIGDPVKDAEQLVATSPLKQAGRIQRPLLMAVGGVDQRVPSAHSLRFKAALPASYTGLTWLWYADEGHGLLKPETRVDFWHQVEAFLAKHLPPNPVAATPAAAASR